MKRKIARQLVKLVQWLHPAYFSLTKITGDQISIGINDVIPDDGKFHHVAATVAANVKIDPDSERKTMSISDLRVYKDGELEKRYQLDEVEI
jgi:hypothetical protein